MSEHEQMSDKDVLKSYLGQYYRAKQRKDKLQLRLENFRAEMGGAKAIEYSDMPKAPCMGNTDGPVVSEVIRELEIEERIQGQREEMKKAMLDVMKILDFLPLDSEERNIIEDRHIDCMSWKQVCKTENITRSPANDRYNRGIDMLLNYKKVQKTVKTYRKTLEKRAEESGQ